MTMNFRTKFINENITLCREHRELLTPWERDEFLANVITVHPDRVTTKQFNTLSGMAAKIRGQMKAKSTRVGTH